MRDAAALLKAAGILAPSEAVPAGEPVDTVQARAWGHPALGARIVVRLVSETLVPGADAEMNALGFSAPTPGPVVGRQRRRAPGFPGWALLNDPKNARYALEVVQDLKKAQRTAQSKPGHAREALIAVGAKLARTTPHFLPSFWEEAGRMFLAVGNHTYAAQSFEKAREAERQFGLAVDEQTRAEAFLEFALAGALAAKSLVAYARSLAESKNKPQAYALFYDLCLRRTLGGVAPFAGMGKELRTLAKAAGLDTAAEERRFLRDALSSPAMAKCPAEAWKTWRTALITLSKEDAGVALRLAELFPSPSGEGGSDDFKTDWIKLLTDVGGFAALGRAESGKCAAWLRKLIGWFDDSNAAVVPVLETLASKLVADAVPVNLVNPESWREAIDPLLLERALALGVPLVTPAEDDTLDLSHWAGGGAAAPDLALIAAEPRFAPLIARSLDRVVGDEDFETAARGKPALKEARRAWLLKHVAELEQKGFPDLESALETLEEKTGPEIYAEFPEALERLKAVDVAPVLRRTLNAGLFDELGWPALEEAWRTLRGPGPQFAEVELSGVFPYLVLHNERTAVVLGPEGVVFTHDLKLGKGGNAVGFRWSGGQLLVIFRNDSYEGKGYWSGHPNEVFDVPSVYQFGWRSQPGALQPDGRITEGTRILSPGDTTFGSRDTIWSDGTSVYAEDDDADEEKTPPAQRPVIRRADPTTGKLQEVARPAFFAAYVAGREDRRLGPTGGLTLLPVPPALRESPLGVHDGLVGQRCRTSLPPEKRPDADEDDDEPTPKLLEIEGIDGRRWTGWVDGDVPSALLRLPAMPADAVLAVTGSGWSSDHGLFAAGAEAEADTEAEENAWRVQQIDSDDDTRPSGTPVLPRLDFWHYFSPRDPAGSAVLRGVGADTARALVEAAVAGAAAREEAKKARSKRAAAASENEDLPITEVREALPGVTHPGLVAGVAQQAAKAADVVRRLMKLTGQLTEAVAAVEAPDPDAFTDSGVHEVLTRRMSGSYYASNPLSGHIAAVAGFFRAPQPGAHTTPASDLPWMGWLGREGALAWLACAPRALTVEDADERQALPKLLRRLADTPWAASPLEYRTEVLNFESEKSVSITLDPDMDPDDYEADDPLPVAAAWVLHEGGHTWAFQRISDDTDRPIEVRALTNAPADALPPDATRKSTKPLGPHSNAAFLRTWAETAATLTATPLPAGLGALIAEGTGLSAPAATLVYAGLPIQSPYASDVLGKPVRELLGLKTTEARQAKDATDDLQADALFDLYDAAVPEEPAALATPLDAGPDGGASLAARFVDAFKRAFGARIPLPEELVAEVDKLQAFSMDAREFLIAVAQPGQPSRYTRDGRFKLDRWGDVERADEGDDVFDGEAAAALCVYLCYAVQALPVGDPFRANLPGLVAAARARLENPELMFGLGTWYGDGKKAKSAQKAWFDSLGGTHWAPPADKDEEPNPIERGRDNGLLLAYCDEDGDPAAAWRPAHARDAAAWRLLEQTRVLFGEEDRGAEAFAVEFLRSDAATVLAEAAGSTALPAGTFEADPRQSAPATVAAAGEALGLDADAATLFLQTLAHAQPTQRNVQQWNGWKPAAYKKAVEALVAKGLVVEGKRPRAGREHFLAGGWEELSAPDLPLESWKAPLYRLTRNENGKLRAPFGQVLPLAPLGTLYAEAWARYAGGDKPALEAVKTGRAAKAPAAAKKKGA